MRRRSIAPIALVLALVTLGSACGDDASDGARGTGGGGTGGEGSAGAGPVAIAAGDACGSARELELGDVGGGVREIILTGTTAGLADDDSDELSSCEGEGAPDGVYAFDGLEGEQVRIELTALDGSFLPILKMRGATHGCMDADDRCEDDPEGPLVIEWTLNDAGLTHVLVDGQNGTSGAFQLSIRVAAR